MIKLIQITKSTFSEYSLKSIYLNPEHIVFMSEHDSMKRDLIEGKINIGLDKNAVFTKIKFNEGDHLSEIAVVGDPASIENKIVSSQRKKLLKG